MTVSNTGPLIALAKANRLDLLERLFGQVEIPLAVHHELFASKSSEVTRLDEALAHFIHVVSTPSISPQVQIATRQLDVGEQQAIALAYEHKTLLLIDDHAGRSVARQLGMSITGIAGVLIRAKKSELIPVVRPILEEIRQRGYWLSDELLQTAIKLAGEESL